MRGLAEFVACLAIAAASHLAMFQVIPDDTAAVTGNTEEARVALAQSSPSLSALVAEWDRPVEAVQSIAGTAPSQPPPVSNPARLVPLPAPRVARSPVPAIARPVETDAVPRVDLTVPIPSNRAAKASARPRTRTDAPQAAPRKPAPATARAKRKAAASSGQPKTSRTQAAAPAAKTTAPAPSPKASPAAMAHWGSSIRSAVERRKRYPTGTRGKGTVTLAVAVSSAGALASVKVRRSSGDARLDNAAVTAVKRARFKPAPRGIAGGVHRFSLPISFSP